jgi:hypothetical protein
LLKINIEIVTIIAKDWGCEVESRTVYVELVK